MRDQPLPPWPLPPWARWSLCAALAILSAWALSRSLPGPGLLDFGSFMGSGKAALEGQDPYGLYPPLTFHVVLPGFEVWNPNLNPPVALLLFGPLSTLEPFHAFRLWWAVSFLGYGALVLLLLRRYRREDPLLPGLWAFALAGFWDTLVLGQIYVPLALAAAGAWLCLDKGKPVAAGLLLGIVIAVKPNFLVWPGLLFLAGHFVPALAAGACALALSLLAGLVYGFETYAQWAQVIANDINRGVFLTNASLPGLLDRMGLHGTGKLASVALLAALAWWAWRQKPDPLRASTLGILGALLASPLAWVHYSLFLLPAFLSGRMNPPLLLAAALLLVPVPWVLDQFMAAPAWQQATIGSAYGWALLLCLLGFSRVGRPTLQLPGARDRVARISTTV